MVEHVTVTSTRGTDAQRLGVGRSDARDPSAAAREAISGALAGRDAGSADVVVVFADVRLDAVAVVDAAMAEASPARLIACSAVSVFSTEGGTARCVALHLPGGALRCGIGWADAAEVPLEEAARAAVGRARDEARPAGHDSAVLVLSDVGAGDQRATLRGSYDVAGATVPLIGGVVGSVGREDRSWVAADGMILQRGVAALWLASRSPLGVGVGHGWHPVGRPLQVTRAAAQVLLELDGRPAPEAYDDAFAALEAADRSPALPGPLRLPVGLLCDDGHYEVRAFVLETDEGIELTGSVHEQAIVRLMSARTDGLIEGAAAAASAAAAATETAVRGGLVFSCTARADLLGPQSARELAAIHAELGAAPAIGFSSYGEFAKVPGSSGIHAASVAVLAL